MRYHLIAIVHPRRVAAPIPFRKPAGVASEERSPDKRVIATIEAAGILGPDQSQRLANLLMRRLCAVFARRGFALTAPELVSDDACSVRRAVI